MVGQEEIGIYIALRQITIAQYFATSPIVELCLAADLILGIRLYRQCYEQPALDIMGIRAWQVSAEGGGESE